MTPQILDGKKLADKIRNRLKDEIALKALRKPAIAFILIGEHAASLAYVRMKKRACEETGIISYVHALDEACEEKKLLDLIEQLNRNPAIDGILVQQPFPRQISTHKVVTYIDPAKDVDGFHPLNLGKLLIDDPRGFIPCTPLGIQEIFKEYAIETKGRRVVIVGRSQIVGKPLGLLLLNRGPFADATVTVAHSCSTDLKAICQEADILVSAVGIPHLIQRNMVKKGAVVIDVGINRGPDGKITGDVAFDEVAPIARAITPVPGGVGPLTIAMLLSNTWKSYQWREGFF